MRAEIASHITISAKLCVGVAVLSRPPPHPPPPTRDAGRCSDKPLRHDPRPDYGDYGDFSSSPRVETARQDLGLLLGRAARRIRSSRQY